MNPLILFGGLALIGFMVASQSQADASDNGSDDDDEPRPFNPGDPGEPDDPWRMEQIETNVNDPVFASYFALPETSSHIPGRLG